MEEYTYDYIHGTDIYLYQHKKMFRINTDTALLAEFMQIRKNETVLDIGTNNGALLLAAHQKGATKLIGVDIQEEAIQVAEKNMKHHKIDEVNLITGDVCDIDLPKVDVIVCNPPYFKVNESSNINESKTLQIARHEQYLTLDRLCKKASELLDKKGRMYLVHRPSRISEIIYVLKKYRLQTRTLQFVYDENRDEAVSVLIEAVKDGEEHTHVLKPRMVER